MQANFFDEHSPYLGHPLLTIKRSRLEVDFIVERLALPVGVRVLDIGCGFGRHSIELAKRGFVVTAIDRSETMITAARAAAQDAGVCVDFQICAGEDFRPKIPYAATLCLFTTLGQVNNDGEDNRPLLAMANKALASDGQLLLELPNREPYLAALRPTDHFGDDNNYTDISRANDLESSIVTERFELAANGSLNHFLLRYRLFTPSQVNLLLNDNGFTVSTTWQDYTAAPLDSGGTMALFHAVKSRELIQIA